MAMAQSVWPTAADQAGSTDERLNACQFVGCEDAAGRLVRIPTLALTLVFCSRHADHLGRAMIAVASGQVQISEGASDRLRVEVEQLAH